MKKQNFVIANWKMNPTTLAEAKKIFSDTKKVAQKLKNTTVIVATPYIYLHSISKLDKPKNLHLASQNFSKEEKGAHTGSISALMVKDAGVKYSILGHSECRKNGESNKDIEQKIQRAVATGIVPIVCVGEQERDKDGLYLEFIKNQIKECLGSIEKKNLFGLILAYEPVWAIGKSYKESMHPTDVHEMTLFIKKVATELFGEVIASSWVILYGGSVEPENAPEIIRIGNVAGFLVGHASLSVSTFEPILKVVDIKKK